MRIHADAERGSVSLAQYFDELRPEDDVFEESAERLFNRLDLAIRRQEKQGS